MYAKALLIIAASSALSSCASLGQPHTSTLGQAQLILANGQAAGTVLVTAAGEKLSLVIAATGIAHGVHGMHLHAIGKCETPGFASAGAHLNPAAHEHGTENPKGSHLGDLPNITADQRGVATLAAPLRMTRSEVQSLLFDGDATAIVIHASPDDYRTDPTGNSGARIACGVLKPV